MDHASTFFPFLPFPPARHAVAFFKNKHAVFGNRWSESVTKINLSSQATVRQQVWQRREGVIYCLFLLQLLKACWVHTPSLSLVTGGWYNTFNLLYCHGSSLCTLQICLFVLPQECLSFAYMQAHDVHWVLLGLCPKRRHIFWLTNRDVNTQSSCSVTPLLCSVFLPPCRLCPLRR